MHNNNIYPIRHAVNLVNYHNCGKFFKDSGPRVYNWSALDVGLNNTVQAIAIHPTTSEIYACGGFTATGDSVTDLNYIAKWDGSSWSALGTGLNDACLDIVFDDSGNLYAGGNFTTAGGETVNRVAKWGWN